MDKLVTVATFTYPSEVAVIRGRLESEGIECFVKDEITAQVHNFISNAIGGVKLQVRQSDVIRATEILKKGGYLDEPDHGHSEFKKNIDSITGRIPLIRKLRIELRMTIFILVFLAVLLFIIYLLSISATQDLYR